MLPRVSTTMALLSRNFLHTFFKPRTGGAPMVSGIDGKVLKRNSASDATNEAISDEQNDTGKGKPKKPTANRRFATNVVEPALELERREDINTIVGIYLGPKSLYWAKVDRHKHVLEWSNVDLFPTVDAGRKMNLPKLFAMLDSVAESIPFSDIFVLETPHQGVLSSVSSPAVINNAILRSQMLAILLTILNLRLENEDASEEYYHKVFLLKQRVVSRFFNLLVGTERVSALTLVDIMLGIKAPPLQVDIPESMDKNRMDGDQSVNEGASEKPMITPVNASRSIIDSYRSLGPIERESMSQALLSALAFYDLVVFKDPKFLVPLKP